MLQTLPGRRTTDYKETNVRITRSSGFVLRKVFYTVPSRLIGHRLGVRLYADRVELYLGSRHQLTLPRGHRDSSSKHWCAHVVNYHHVIHSLRRKPMALMSWVYRDQLFPHEANRHCFEVALERTTPRQACRLAVQLLSLVGSRPQLRSPAGAADRTMPAARRASGHARDAKAICRAARYHSATACGIEHAGQLCVAAAARS